MDLNVGGYLIYGYKLLFFGYYYEVYVYGVSRDDERIDYEEVLKIVIEVKFKMIIVGVSVYLRVIDFKKFREIVDIVGVYLFVDMVYIVGLVVCGLYLLLLFYVDVVIFIIYKILRGLCGGIIFINDVSIVKKIDCLVFFG